VLRAVLESPQRIVIFALDRQYRYLAYNKNHARTMKQIWGVEIHVGLCMLDVIGRPDDRAKAQANFDRALAGESFTLIEEYGDTRIDRRFYEDVYSPVRSEDGRISGLAVYLTDITEQRRAELELERYRDHLEELVEQRTRELESAHAQLLHAQKLESLGVLAGGIAHDFNNLLAIVLARAELSLKDCSDPALVNSHVSIIRDTALEARMLTRQLLSYAGKGKVLVELLDLNQLVTSMSQLLRASVSKVIRLELLLCPDAVPVQVDVTQLRQVILNLVTNAAEAIDAAGGNIWVRTGCVEVTPATAHSSFAPIEPPAGSYAFLEVEDDGIGISEETRGRLYDPFFTTKFSGRGLGLAAVLGIVKSHNGAILLDTQPGEGSRFRVLLPLEDVTPLCEPTPNTSYAELSTAEACVLVVDDEAPVRAATSEILRSLGYRVYQADGGISACRVFRQHLREIDIVLLDLAMPDMNGEQTLRQLKKLRSDVRVILLTAYAEDEFRVRFLKGDLAGFLTKPFARDELIQALRAPSATSSG